MTSKTKDYAPGAMPACGDRVQFLDFGETIEATVVRVSHFNNTTVYVHLDSGEEITVARDSLRKVI